MEISENLKQAFDKVPCGIGIFEIKDGITRRLYMNDWFYHMTEHSISSKEDYNGEDFWNMIFKDDYERVKQSMEEVMKGADYSVASCRVHKDDGELKWIRLVSNVTERNAEHILVYTSYVDMTKEVEIRTTLEQSNDLLQRAMNISHMVVWEYDPVRKTLIQSRNCTKLTGYKNIIIQNAPESMIAAGYVKEEFIADYRRFFDKFCNEQVAVKAEFQVKNWETEEYWWEKTSLTPVFDDEGNLVKGIGTSIDISEQKKKDQEKEQLRKAESALEIANKANSAKTEFLSRMSHDIRTPMNAIINLTHLAEEESDITTIKEYLQNISASSDFLLGLINDILDVSKIESGELELRPESYERTDFVKSINTVMKPLMDARKINFTFNINTSAKCIMVDKLRFNQIFFNLLSNAAKFTEVGGKVEFIVSDIDDKDSTYGMRYIVRDNGIGMSKEFLPHLFESFSQERTKETENITGSGLGLPIVKSLVDAMGGTIHVTSELGKGTEYIIDLHTPLAESKSVVDEELNEHYSLRDKEILLVEDNEMNVFVAKKLLESKGCKVTVVRNGQEAVEKFEESKDGYFKAILMDVRMPVMDGITATKIIRGINKSDSQLIPIIAMTADAFSEEQQKTKDAGMNYHLAKPIEPKNLYETLSKCIAEYEA